MLLDKLAYLAYKLQFSKFCKACRWRTFTSIKVILFIYSFFFILLYSFSFV